MSWLTKLIRIGRKEIRGMEFGSPLKEVLNNVMSGMTPKEAVEAYANKVIDSNGLRDDLVRELTEIRDMLNSSKIIEARAELGALKTIVKNLKPEWVEVLDSIDKALDRIENHYFVKARIEIETLIAKIKTGEGVTL
jgi:hypothetical protein